MDDLMDIYSKPGSKIQYLNTSKAYPSMVDYNVGILKKDGIYTVDHTDVFSSYTIVYLKEFPGIKFQSANFKNVGIDFDEMMRLISKPAII